MGALGGGKKTGYISIIFYLLILIFYCISRPPPSFHCPSSYIGLSFLKQVQDKAKTTATEAAVEAMPVAGGVDTGAVTTAMTASMVKAAMMTRLNVCDASTEEKERPSILSRMHATIK